MEQKQVDILQSVGALFMKFGVKSLTMDGISKQLKVSKKTLYKYVSSKADLVNKVIQLKCDGECFLMESISKNSGNAIDEIIEISKYVSGQLQQVNPSIHFELSNFYPKAFETFMDHKQNVIGTFVEQNLKRGIEEGLYRENLNPTVIARLHIHKIDALFDPEIFPPNEISFIQAHNEMMRYHIRGIANERGIEYMKEKLKKEQINIF